MRAGWLRDQARSETGPEAKRARQGARTELLTRYCGATKGIIKEQKERRALTLGLTLTTRSEMAGLAMGHTRWSPVASVPTGGKLAS